MLVKVKGGTGAGKRRERVVPKTDWVCAHGHLNIRHAVTCLTGGCLERRPR